jgi:hypothetical protein
LSKLSSDRFLKLNGLTKPVENYQNNKIFGRKKVTLSNDDLFSRSFASAALNNEILLLLLLINGHVRYIIKKILKCSNYFWDSIQKHACTTSIIYVGQNLLITNNSNNYNNYEKIIYIFKVWQIRYNLQVVCIVYIKNDENCIKILFFIKWYEFTTVNI